MVVVVRKNYNWFLGGSPKASASNNIEIYNSSSAFVNNDYIIDSTITTSLPYIEYIALNELIAFRVKLK